MDKMVTIINSLTKVLNHINAELKAIETVANAAEHGGCDSSKYRLIAPPLICVADKIKNVRQKALNMMADIDNN